MKVIFLDIDGVLNSTDWYSSGRCPGNINGQEGDLDPDNMKILNKLIEQTQASIVISSDWRINFQATCNRLYRAGLEGNILGATPSDWKSYYGSGRSRGEEVQEWIDKNLTSEDQYLILDDREDFLDSQMSNYVHINPMYGLQEIYLTQAVQILST